MNTHTQAIAVDRHGAAKLLNVCVRTIDELRKRGDIPHFYIGTHPRFPVDGLRDWAREQSKR